MLTYEQNVKAILECFFPGHKDELIEDACKKICTLKCPEKRESKIGHCKDCKYFEYDSPAKVDGIPLIVAHEICNKWGGGCKTNEDGYCFLFEPRENDDDADWHEISSDEMTEKQLREAVKYLRKKLMEKELQEKKYDT